MLLFYFLCDLRSFSRKGAKKNTKAAPVTEAAFLFFLFFAPLRFFPPLRETLLQVIIYFLHILILLQVIYQF